MSDDISIGAGKSSFLEFRQAIEDSIFFMSASDEELQEYIDRYLAPEGETATPAELRKMGRDPILVIGDPGIGKTCGIIGAIKDHNKTVPESEQWGFSKIQLGQTIVGALQGIPVVDPSTHKAIRVDVPELPRTDPNDPAYKKYGILFLDEITSADTAQVQPALGLCDDSRNIGTYTLPENWLVVAAGNGPNCANFRELHDMTISRFIVFDVAYSFEDWEQWAIDNNIHQMILAYLGWKPENIVHVVSDALADAEHGKAFACPRSWERLSREMKKRRAMGRAIGTEEMASIAPRVIGDKIGNEFASFCAFEKVLKKNGISAEKILDGNIALPTRETIPTEEEYHIIMQSLISHMRILGDKYDAGAVKEEVAFQKVINATKWIVALGSFQLELVITAFATLGAKVPLYDMVISDPDYMDTYCPEWGRFIDEHVAEYQNAQIAAENHRIRNRG